MPTVWAEDQLDRQKIVRGYRGHVPGSPVSMTVTAVSLERFPHDQHILRRYIRLDIVHWRENKASTWSQGIDIPAHVVFHSLRRACGQDLLSVDAAPPEDESISKVPLQRQWLHPCRT